MQAELKLHSNLAAITRLDRCKHPIIACSSNLWASTHSSMTRLRTVPQKLASILWEHSMIIVAKRTSLESHSSTICNSSLSSKQQWRNENIWLQQLCSSHATASRNDNSDEAVIQKLKALVYAYACSIINFFNFLQSFQYNSNMIQLRKPTCKYQRLCTKAQSGPSDSQALHAKACRPYEKSNINIHS